MFDSISTVSGSGNMTFIVYIGMLIVCIFLLYMISMVLNARADDSRKR